MEGNPWERWGLVQSRRDGWPVLSQTQLWHLQSKHPNVLERTPKGELLVHLDITYRVRSLPDRDYTVLEPMRNGAKSGG